MTAWGGERIAAAADPVTARELDHLARGTDSGIESVDWFALLCEEVVPTDWLAEPFLPRGRQVALYGDPKAGKSLLALDVATSLSAGREVLGRPAGDPVSVMYLDQENGRDDLRERVNAMDYEPEDLALLAYYQLQDLPPLDSAAGGLVIEQLLDRHRPELVIVDTTASLVKGPEDSADTIRDLYRFSGRIVKDRRVALLRLDHSGKDRSAGQRGTSHKAGDVDVVFALTISVKDSLLTLRCTHSRIPWVPREIVLHREEEPTLRHLLAQSGGVLSSRVQALARLLDDLEVPIDATKRAAMETLKSANEGRRATDVLAALAQRKERR